MPKPNDVVTASDAARELGLSVSTLTRRAQLGTIPARKVGNVWIIRRRDLPKIAAKVKPKPRGAVTES